MRYIIFTPSNENELKNVYRSLSNITPELNSNISILLWTDNEEVYLNARNNYPKYVEGGTYNDFLCLFSGDKLDCKNSLIAQKGSVLLVHPNHILGYGCLETLYFEDRIYKYGLIAGQIHDWCIDCEDLYDETTAHKVGLFGHDRIGKDIFMVDNVLEATVMVKLKPFFDYWFDDGNLGIYLRRLGYCNFVDKSLNIKRGK